MIIKIGYSPCPNDTFIFGALINGLIDSQGIEFQAHLADVEALNGWAQQELLDVTKISFNAFLGLTTRYQLLDSGSALGNHCGPLLISLRDYKKKDLSTCTIAIPGEKTTANFLLDYYHPAALNKEVLVFDQIESSVLDGSVDAGVIIHENRFTYAERGLQLIADLGLHWENATGQPIPLGGIVAKSSLPPDLALKIEQLIAASLQFAWKNPDAVMPYVRDHAQEMKESVMKQHIELYVNEFTKSLGSAGRQAVKHFFEEAVVQGRIEKPDSIFYFT